MEEELLPYHYGMTVKERRMNRSLKISDLSRMTAITSQRIIEIERVGNATFNEKQRIDSALNRNNQISGLATSVIMIDEQYEIVEMLKRTIIRRLQERCINPIIIEHVLEYLNSIAIESAYYGLLASRAGTEELVLDKVRERRAVK